MSRLAPKPAARRTLLCEQVAERLRRETLLHRQVGDRLDSVDNLAVQYAVSRTTICQALDLLSHAGLVEKKHGSGVYVVDHSEKRHVAVLMEGDMSHPQMNFFARRLAQRLVMYCREQGYQSRLYVGHAVPGEPSPRESTCPEFMDAVKRQELCGVLAVQSPALAQWTEPLRRQRVPVVGMGGEYANGVQIDLADMVHKGVRFLLKQGRRKIGMLYYDEPLPEGQVRQKSDLIWQRAFVQAMQAAGQRVFEPWLVSSKSVTASGAGWDAFRDMWTTSKEKPDGLLICDDNLLSDARIAMAELNVRMPEDLLVVSHANKGSQIVYPPCVQRLEFDPTEFVQTMGSMLVGLMQRKSGVQKQIVLSARDIVNTQSHAAVLPCQIVER